MKYCCVNIIFPSMSLCLPTPGNIVAHTKFDSYFLVSKNLPQKILKHFGRASHCLPMWAYASNTVFYDLHKQMFCTKILVQNIGTKKEKILVQNASATVFASLLKA